MEKYYEEGMTTEELMDALKSHPGISSKDADFKYKVEHFIYNKKQLPIAINRIQNAIKSLNNIISSIENNEKQIGLKSMPAYYRIMNSIEVFEKTLKKPAKK